jgi:hypothetical protein
MPVYQGRAIIDGRLLAATVERDVEPTKEEWEEILLDSQAEELEKKVHGEGTVLPVSREEVIPNRKLNGKKFINLEFQCKACLAPLQAEFRDGYLQIAPCPECLGEMEKVVEATRRFLERKK